MAFFGRASSSFSRIMNHEAGKSKEFEDFIGVYFVLLGPKTVHFWAPMFKWGLVIAGLADLKRPVEKVSLFQSAGMLYII
jgi:hypothetical protein